MNITLPGTFSQHITEHNALFSPGISLQAGSSPPLEIDYLVRIDQIVDIDLVTTRFSTLKCLI